jgi:nucleoside triphosphate pyrophosphatase
MRFLLASASPARLRTLRSAGIEAEVQVSGVDEDAISAAGPVELVQALATAKAVAVAALQQGELLLLGCDSMLEFDGAILGKPADPAEAVQRWQQLRGRAGTLHTGHTLIEIRDGSVSRQLERVASTEVRFANPSDAEIAAYVGTGEPLRVAGAFTIDGLGGWFVESIDGDHHNVVGLSLPTLRGMLAELGHGLTALGYPYR